MLLDRSSWRRHLPWLIGCVLAFLAALAWFLIDARDASEWPGGSSLPGFSFGVLGAVLIIFEFILWPRKKLRAWHIGSAQAWLRAHIWLGLLCWPILVLHSGLRVGGTLTTALMIVLTLVVASGVWGLVLQNLLPTRMMGEMPGESSYAQQGFLVQQLIDTADELVSASCGTTEPAPELSRDDIGLATVVTGRLVTPQAPAAPIPDAEALGVFYREQVAPFLRDGTAADSPLVSASRSAAAFQAMRLQLPPAAHEIIDALEIFCQQRRASDQQARLHFWLHNWLWVHFPLSVTLLVLMAAHVFVALKFW